MALRAGETFDVAQYEQNSREGKATPFSARSGVYANPIQWQSPEQLASRATLRAPAATPPAYQAPFNMSPGFSAAEGTDANSLYGQAMDATRGISTQMLNSLEQEAKSSKGGVLQSDISGQMLHTTAAPSVGIGFANAYSRALREIAPSLMSSKLQAMATFGGMAQDQYRESERLKFEGERLKLMRDQFEWQKELSDPFSARYNQGLGSDVLSGNLKAGGEFVARNPFSYIRSGAARL